MECGLKRKKAIATAEDDAEEEDKISRLSDDLIHIIMSYLDVKLVVQTCVISRRWKLVWTTLPFLKFKCYYPSSPKALLPQTTPKFVGRVFKHRDRRSQVSSLKLMLITPTLFTKFVEYAISHHVRYLNGHLRSGHYNLSIFSSNSIRTLKLKMKFQDIVLESDCWVLPNLTTLHLTRVHYDHSHNLPELFLTCLPALTTLCLTDWDLGQSSFSFSLPALTTLRFSECKLPNIVWNFPALKTLALHDVVFPLHGVLFRRKMKELFSSLVNLQNLTLFFYKNFVQNCVLDFPQLLNLEIKTRYYHKNGLRTGCIEVSAPKLRNFISVGIFTVILRKAELDNVFIKLRGWIDHMILPRDKLKEYYESLTYMLSRFGSAKTLRLDLETIEALSLITNHLVRSPSPFLNLKYVKLPMGCEEPNICSTVRRYLLGGSPTATIVTALPQNEFNGWNNEKRQISSMLCWTLWKCRNNLVWNQKGMEVEEVVESAKVVLRQWQYAQDKSYNNFLGYMTPEDGTEQWTLPTENKFKVNTDAAIFKASNCYSFAYVVRNHSGDLVKARSSCIEGISSPECAEAMGIREALSWIKNHQLGEVTVESDCLAAVQAIRSSAKLLSYFGRIIGDCRVLLSELENKGVSLNFVKRSANNVAHYLARYSCSIADRIWRVNNVHPEFLHVLKNDLKF